MDKQLIIAQLGKLESFLKKQCRHDSSFQHIEIQGEIRKRCSKCGKEWKSKSEAEVDALIVSEVSDLAEMVSVMHVLQRETQANAQVIIGTWDGVLRHSELIRSSFRIGSAWVQSGEGVQIVHMPTQIKVTSQEARSVHRNYVLAMDILREQLQVYCVDHGLIYQEEPSI